jgi:hypothetical protein
MSIKVDNIFLEKGSAIVGNKVYGYNDSAWRVVGLLNDNFTSVDVSKGIINLSFDSDFDEVTDAINPIIDFVKTDENGNTITWDASVLARASNNILNIIPPPATVSYTPPYTLVPNTDFKTGVNKRNTVDVVFTGRVSNSMPDLGFDSGDVIAEFDKKIEIVLRYNPISTYVIGANHPKALNLINMGTPEIQYKASTSFTLPSDLSGLAFDSDGNKMFVLSNSGDIVYSYPISGYDISTVVNTPAQFTIYGYQGDDVTDIDFNSTGTRMYIVDNTYKFVRQFNLSVPFDITTSEFIENYYQSSSLFDKTSISENGEYMYSLDNSGNLYKFDLNKNYEIYTSGYNYKTVTNFPAYETTKIYPGYPSYYEQYIAGAQVGWFTVYYGWNTIFYHRSFPQCFTFSQDGSRLVIATGLSIFNGRIQTYQLSTPWNPTTRTLAFTSFHEFGYPTTERFLRNYKENGISHIQFNPDGTKFFVLDRETTSLYQYNLSTPFVINSIGSSTLKPVDKLIASGGYDKAYKLTQIPDPAKTDSWVEVNQINTFQFRENGAILYVHNNVNVYKYGLSTPYDISSVSYLGSFPIAELGNSSSLVIRSNNLYIAKPNIIWQYQMDSDIPSAFFKYNEKSLAVPDSTLTSIYLNDSDNEIYVGSSNRVYKFDLSENSELSSATLDSSVSVVNGMNGFTISETNDKLFVCSGTKIYEYDINDSDWSATTFANQEYQSTGSITNIRGMKWNEVGDVFLTVGDTRVESYKTKNLFRTKPL